MINYLFKSTALFALGVFLAGPAMAGGFSGFGFSYGASSSSYGISLGAYGSSLFYGDRHGSYALGFSDSRHRYSGHAGGYGHYSYGRGYSRAPVLVRYVYREPVYYGRNYPAHRQYQRHDYRGYPGNRQYRRSQPYAYRTTRHSNTSHPRTSRVIISDYPRYQSDYSRQSSGYRDRSVRRPGYRY